MAISSFFHFSVDCKDWRSWERKFHNWIPYALFCRKASSIGYVKETWEEVGSPRGRILTLLCTTIDLVSWVLSEGSSFLQSLAYPVLMLTALSPCHLLDQKPNAWINISRSPCIPATSLDLCSWTLPSIPAILSDVCSQTAYFKEYSGFIRNCDMIYKEMIIHMISRNSWIIDRKRFILLSKRGLKHMFCVSFIWCM